MTSNNEWRSQVIRKIEILIREDTELAKILFYLALQAQACNGYQNSEIWLMLKDLLLAERVFLAYLKQILQEIDKDSESVRDPIVEVFNQMCLKGTTNNDQLDISQLNAVELTVCGSVGFLHSWHCISPEAQTRVIKVIPQLAKSVAPITAVEKTISVVNSLGKRASTALAVIYLTFEAMKNIYRWWNGEITGKRLAKNIIDSCSSVGAGFGGGVGGAYVGAFLGPVGIVVGGVIGSIVVSVGASVLVDKLTQNIFNIPKDEVLEAAFNFLGVNRKSPNEEINKAYHSLCLKYHPDKGGSTQMFLQLQTYMGVIKVARGEQYI